MRRASSANQSITSAAAIVSILGFRARLALLADHDPGDGIAALAKYFRGLAHQLGALVSGLRAPGFEAFLDRLECIIKISLGGVRDLADDLFRCGINHINGLAFRAGAPLAVDEQLRVGICAVLSHDNPLLVVISGRAA